MILYVVTKQGVYRHEVLGIFDTADAAAARALEASLAEEDGYHAFRVSMAQVNRPTDDLLSLFEYRRKRIGGIGWPPKSEQPVRYELASPSGDRMP